MTLRKKTLAIIAVTSVSLIAILYIISRVFLLGGYASLEEQSTHKNVERVLSALSEEITVLDTTVFDWASWDDTYTFIEARDPNYVQSNLIDETFFTIGLNLMLFVDAFGQKVFAKGFDLHNETEVPVPQAFLGDLLANDLLISHHETESSVTGIVLLSEGPMLVASRPILTSKDEGPIRGALVMGHYLDTTEIERLAQVTHLSFTVQRFNDSLLPPDFQEARVALSGKETMLVRPISDESIAGYALLEDIYGKPALLLRVDMPREIYKQGKASIVVFTSLLLAAGLAFGVVTLLLLERQVPSRLAHLCRSVGRIGARGDLSARVAIGETDEISRVGSSINEMLSELEQSEKALRESEARFRHLYDSNMLGIAFWKSSGVIEDANDAYLDMIGYDRQELQSGKVRWQHITPPEYAHLDKKGLEQLRATGICPPFEKEYIRKDGTRILVLIGAAFLNGEDDIGVSYLVNLTERERTETALAQANTELQALQQVTEAIHSTLTLEDVFQKITDGLVHSMGYTSAFIAHLNDQKDRVELKAFSTQQHLVPQIDKVLGFPLRDFSFPPDPETNATIKSVMNGRQVVAKTLAEVAHPLISKGTCLALQKLGRIKNYIVTPLKFHEEIVGALVITTTREEVSEEELKMIMTFANAATRAIRNADLHRQTKRAEEALRHRARQLQIISDVGRRVSAILNLDELLSYVVTTIQQSFDYYHVDIFLVDQDRDYAVFTTSSNPTVAERRKEQTQRFKVGKEGMIGWVAKAGEPLLANDVSQEPRYLPDELLPEIKSELAVPLKVEERTIGVLDVNSDRLNAFSKDDIFVLETLGHQAAIAIENARLFQESQRRTEEMTALREVSLATLSSLDQDQVFEIMLDQIGKFIDYVSASIKIITPDGWEKMIAGRGPIIHEQIMWDGFDMKENKLLQEMKETRQPVVVHNTHTDERYQRVGNWEAFHSWVGAPLFVRGDLIGHLDVEITSPGFYDENTVQLLGDFARTAAIALENAELYDKARQHAKEMASLHKIGLTTTSTLDLDEVLKLIYEQVSQLMKPDTFYIALYDEQKEEINFEIYVEKGQDLGKFSGKLEEGGLTSWIIQSNQPLLVRNTAKESWPTEPLVTGEIAPEMSYLGVPLLAKGKVIGVISVESFRPYTYNEEDQYFLTAVADQAAVAIENARLFEEAHRRAEQMAIVNRIARATSATLHLDDLMETVYREIAPIFQGDAFFIALYDEETDELDFRFLVDEGVRGYPGRISLGGLSSVVVTEKKPLIIREFEQERDRLPEPLLMGTDKLPASWLGVPMLIGERAIGVINVQSYLPRTWGEDDELLLCTIADQVAVALENARLFEEAQHRAEEMAVLNELGQVLTARLNVEEVLVEAYHQASRLVDTTNFYIGLYDEEKDKVTFPFNVSESEIDNQITVMSASQGITGYIIRNRTSVLLGENGLDWQEEKGVETFGQEAPAWLGVPLMLGDRVLGVMVVQSYTTPNLYVEHDRDLLTAIASPTAIALENAQLFEAVQQELAERVRTEKALRESEGRFRRLYDSNTLGIVYWDSSDRLVDANDAFLDIIGYTRQDLLAGNLHLQDITPLEYRHLDKKGFDELRKTGSCSPFEKEYVRKDGTRVSVLIGGAFLESEGEVGVSYVIDVTERKQMEKALHESEERFALAVQGANDGIWDWDIQKDSLYWSPRMKELLGYADDELDVDFDTFEVTLHPDDRERTKATMEARLKDGQLYDADHRLHTKSGEYRWFHARGQVILDEAGNPIRMIGSTADVTDRKQAEERLHATLQGMIEALGQTTETRDLYTAGHQKRVTQLACAIASEMGLSKGHIESIRIAGLVHDIGKMAIPAEILSKPSRLSEMEYGLIKAHPQIAYDVVKPIEFPWPVAQIVLQHHERMDGSGYPQGLKGEEIMLEARILAVADVVEAMASHRPYRPALGIDKALEEIAQNKGALYDPVVVDTCLRLFDEKKFSFEGDPSPGEA